MAEIRAFRGVRYNPALAGDLAGVICPPYDIISPRMHEALHRQSEYNFVRLEFAREMPGDTAAENRYTRAAATLQQWLERGVLETDGQPAIYLHDQRFTHGGREYRRRGIIAVIRLEEWSQNVVRPHEGTLSAPKSDRLNLIRALQANTSPILAMYEDAGQQVGARLAGAAQGAPLFDISLGGEGHRLWAITDKDSLDQIRRGLAEQPLYIADGHHRYESALNYRRERRAASPDAGDQPYDFVMMTLVDLADPGLVILPTHRLVRGIPPSTLERMLAGLNDLFEIEPEPPGTLTFEPASREGQLELLMAGPSRGLARLRLCDFSLVQAMMPPAASELYRRLDVSVVDHVILEKLLGLDLDKAAGQLDYSHDGQDAAKRVRVGEYQLAFLLGPVRATVIKAIAAAGERMPRKSTYFYPKLPSGLVCYRLV